MSTNSGAVHCVDKGAVFCIASGRPGGEKSNLGAVLEHKAEGVPCAHSLSDGFQFFHRETPVFQPSVKDLWRGTKAPGKLRLGHPFVGQGHFDFLFDGQINHLSDSIIKKDDTVNEKRDDKTIYNVIT